MRKTPGRASACLLAIALCSVPNVARAGSPSGDPVGWFSSIIDFFGGTPASPHPVRPDAPQGASQHRHVGAKPHRSAPPQHVQALHTAPVVATHTPAPQPTHTTFKVIAARKHPIWWIGSHPPLPKASAAQAAAAPSSSPQSTTDDDPSTPISPGIGSRPPG